VLRSDKAVTWLYDTDYGPQQVDLSALSDIVGEFFPGKHIFPLPVTGRRIVNPLKVY